MPRAKLEIADIFRAHGPEWRQANAGHVSLTQLKAMPAIEARRTEALGGHVASCTKCGHQHIAYNSCRNRHCPRCQGPAARDWIAARAEDLLPVEYFHVVFTLPAEIARIAFWSEPSRRHAFKTDGEPGGLRAAVPRLGLGRRDHRWVADRLEALDAEVPVLFDEGDGVDFEAVAGTAPDVILAAYSGISRQDYEVLSQIAPVIAYPEAAWTTTWREMIRQNAAGINMAEEGEALVHRLEERIETAVARHPALAGKTGMFVTHLDPRDLSTIGFYASADQRVQFLQDLGMEIPEAVRAASEAGEYSGRISAERVDIFDDVDVVVTYGDPARLAEMKQNPLIVRFPAIARDAVVLLGNDAVGTAANPTPLSFEHVLDDYVAMLARAAAQ